MIWRIHELGETAVECFDQNRAAAGMILVRGLFESALVIFLVELKMSKFEPSQHNELKALLSKLWAGEGNDSILLNPVKPTKIIGYLKDLQGIKKVYDSLSNYSHPNRSAQRLSSVYDSETTVMTFGNFPKNSIEFGAGVLCETLRLVEISYNSITELMSDFTAKCEIAVAEGKRTAR